MYRKIFYSSIGRNVKTLSLLFNRSAVPPDSENLEDYRSNLVLSSGDDSLHNLPMSSSCRRQPENICI